MATAAVSDGQQKPSHTEGVWAARDEDGQFLDPDDWQVENWELPGFSYVPVKAGDKVVALVVSGAGVSEDELDANSLLLAAAKDLLAALEQLYRLHCDDVFRLPDEHYKAICNAATAIAKAGVS